MTPRREPEVERDVRPEHPLLGVPLAEGKAAPHRLHEGGWRMDRALGFRQEDELVAGKGQDRAFVPERQELAERQAMGCIGEFVGVRVHDPAPTDSADEVALEAKLAGEVEDAGEGLLPHLHHRGATAGGGDRRRPVGRAVVDDDDLGALRQEMVEEPRERPGGVAAGDDGGEPRERARRLRAHCGPGVLGNRASA
jgi:hypothetical protein